MRGSADAAGGSRLVIVVAVARNGVIGRDNRLPWRLKTDLRRFRRLTLGKPMIMGRRSWESVGRPLPGRESIVLTRDPAYRAEGAHMAHDWSAACREGGRLARAMGTDDIVIFGGADIFRAALPDVARIHLTCVDAEIEGDVTFPPYDREAFGETWREAHPAGPDDEHAFTFIDLTRRLPLTHPTGVPICLP